MTRVKIEADAEGRVTSIAAGPIEPAIMPQDVRVPQPAPEPPPPAIPFAKQSNGPHPRNALAQGLARFDDLEAERDQLKRELASARERIHLLEIHISELEGTRATIESRINTCVLQRDEAVGKEGEVRGVLNAIAAICAKYHDVKVD